MSIQTFRPAVVLPFFMICINATAVGAEDFRDFVTERVLPIFDSIIALVMVLAVIAFTLGVARFMYSAGDDKSRSAGKSMMLWGTIALFVMVSVWGIVKIIKTTFFSDTYLWSK